MEYEDTYGREIVIRFKGGTMDGAEYSSLSDGTADIFWMLSDSGKVGKEFRQSPVELDPGKIVRVGNEVHILGDFAKQSHRYKVIDREDSKEKIVVTIEFVGAE